MQATEFVQQAKDARYFYQRMIMIRQHTPCKRLTCVCGEYGQQIVSEGIHAFRAVTDVGMVFEAGRSDMEAQLAEARAVWW